MTEPSFLPQLGQKQLLCLKPSLEMRNNLEQTIHIFKLLASRNNASRTILNSLFLFVNLIRYFLQIIESFHDNYYNFFAYYVMLLKWVHADLSIFWNSHYWWIDILIERTQPWSALRINTLNQNQRVSIAMKSAVENPEIIFTRKGQI